MKIENTQMDLGPGRGIWRSLTPRSGIEGFECSVITVEDPLLNLPGPYAKLVVPHLTKSIFSWLYSAAKSSINISSSHRLIGNVCLYCLHRKSHSRLTSIL